MEKKWTSEGDEKTKDVGEMSKDGDGKTKDAEKTKDLEEIAEDVDEKTKDVDGKTIGSESVEDEKKLETSEPSEQDGISQSKVVEDKKK